ncbi:beta-lactamase family protein [Vibrio cholerae]|nr:beta-lactamase family protein [Vibrio cholerae]
MKIDSRMLAASIGKTFVPASILLLVRYSSISLDDKLSCYLADRPWFNELPNSKQITIRQLLQYTSGLADHVYLPEFRQRFADSLENPLLSKMETEDVIAILHKTDPLFESGEGWAYSDTGYLILGLVIEHVTQQNYYTWVNEKF